MQTYVDHKGNIFTSIPQMASYWNVSERTLYTRINVKKMSVEEALTTPVINTRKNVEWCDHLGNKFISKVKLCEAYNISCQMFTGRIKLGWSLEKALTTPPDQPPSTSKPVIDHEGRSFKSVSAMCKYWGVPRSTYNLKIKQGFTIEDALTKEVQKINTTKQEWTDHKGNTYPSLNAMCAAYNITHYTFKTRIDSLGWSLEDALTKGQVITSIACEDLYGNSFPAKCDMANYYCIADYRLQGNRIAEKSFEDILTTSWLAQKKIGPVIVKKVIAYPYFLVDYNDHEYIFDIHMILDIYHSSEYFKPIPESKIKNKSFEIMSCDGFPNYTVRYKNVIQTWSYWDIIKYRHDTNFGLSKRKG